MRITVSAYGEFRRYVLGGQAVRTVELPEGATLNEVASVLQVNPDELLLARRSGELVRESTVLHEGDHIEFFAPVGGG